MTNSNPNSSMKLFNVYTANWEYIECFYSETSLGFTSIGDYRIESYEGTRIYIKYMG
jgi:hypothetical protein